MGMEWLYRLLAEPRRLWRRYFTYNSLFVWHSVRDALRGGPPVGSEKGEGRREK
jgi:N-acetylglucosaminyldiphosphoundecaprenol N-acetyl-beta-D-mannosaminyltransferase